jgi:hypothetical protein
MDSTTLEVYISNQVRQEGIARYSRSVIELAEDVIRDKKRSEMEFFVSIYTELLNYPGAPVNNLRYERRRIAAELLQIAPSRSRGE